MAAVDRLQLDLTGLRVLTEAATGPYVVTPVIAVFAGAEVVALAKDSRYGTVAQASQETQQLSRELGVANRIEIVERLGDGHVASAHIVTNSGHLRPLDADFVGRMKRTAVIPLMYESWELRSTDVDLDACRRHGIRVAGTNERDPRVGVFDYLGVLVVKAILNEGYELVRQRCLVVSDNDFGEFVKIALKANGAKVQTVPPHNSAGRTTWDIVVVASTPPLCGGAVVSLEGVDAGLYCQLWGDVDRSSASGRWCPQREPRAGHMGLTLDRLGPDPVTRLQAGGLKVGEVLARCPRLSREDAIPDDHTEHWTGLVEPLV